MGYLMARVRGRLRSEVALLGILGVALVLRLLALAATSNYAPSGDPADYLRHGFALQYFGTYAHTLLAAPGGASAVRPPGYPYLLAAIFEVSGGFVTPARLAGVALGVVSVWLVYLIAAQLWDRRVALWAAAIAAVFPPLAWLSASLVAENLFLPLMLATVYGLLRMQRSDRRTRWAAAVGLTLALATLTRSNALVLLLPALAAAWPPRGTRSSKAGYVPAAVLAATFLLALVPWTIRNEQAFGRFLPLGTQSGYTLAGAYNSQANNPDDLQAVWRTAETTPDYARLFHRQGYDEGRIDAELRSSASSYAADHPGYVLRVMGLNALRLFDLGPGHSFVSDVSYTEMAIPERWIGSLRAALYLVLGLALAGLFATVLSGAFRAPWWFWAFPVLMLLSVDVMLGAPRYRAPVDPFLVMLAAIAIVRLARRRGLGPARF
jgi:4-amino-4-deoxy-L-arabinose transferase-like glycosyltransferase